MCRVKDICEIMDRIAPQAWAEEWDNVGLLLGNDKTWVKRLMVTLDISPEVIDEAINKNIDMIIAHHPLIFSPIKRLVENDFVGQLIYPLVSNKIAVFCAHTNLDMAPGGIDDSLAKRLEVEDIKYLYSKEKDREESKPGFGRWGRIKAPMTGNEFANFAKKKLKASQIEYIGDPNKEIGTIALCGGSGSDFMGQAKALDVDLFVTGEIKYHDALAAQWLGIDILTLGHFHTETPGMEVLIRRLQKTMNSLQYKVEVISSEMQKAPFSLLMDDL